MLSEYLKKAKKAEKWYRYIRIVKHLGFEVLKIQTYSESFSLEQYSFVDFKEYNISIGVNYEMRDEVEFCIYIESKASRALRLAEMRKLEAAHDKAVEQRNLEADPYDKIQRDCSCNTRKFKDAGIEIDKIYKKYSVPIANYNAVKYTSIP